MRRLAGSAKPRSPWLEFLGVQTRSPPCPCVCSPNLWNVHRPLSRPRVPWQGVGRGLPVAEAANSLCLAAEFVPLRADHGRRDPALGKRRLRPRPLGSDRAGQLPPDHRRVPGAPEELPQPGEDRTVRLSADHAGRDQETQGKENKWKLKHH